jgi:hypothetical protein
MAQKPVKSEQIRAAWRKQAAVPGWHGRGHEAARVVVAWSSPSDTEGGRCLAPVNLELEASSSATAGGSWRCHDLSGVGWVEAISAAHCTEVVLTAHLGPNGRGRHLVLELAEILTHRLSATKPHIRVRFEPSGDEANSSRARSAQRAHAAKSSTAPGHCHG